MGRQDRYQSHIQPRLAEISSLCETMTEAQIAQMMGVAPRTFQKYKAEHADLREALQKGTTRLVAELKDTLKRKARGFHYTETKKTIKDIDGVRTQVVEEYERYSLPDTGAIHLLLKNLDENWRNDDKPSFDLKREKLELEKQKADDQQW